MTLQLLNYWQCDRLILIAVKSYAVTIQMKPLLFDST